MARREKHDENNIGKTSKTPPMGSMAERLTKGEKVGHSISDCGKSMAMVPHIPSS